MLLQGGRSGRGGMAGFKRMPKPQVLITGLAALAVLFFMLQTNRHARGVQVPPGDADASGHADLMQKRARLLSELESWNAEARAQGMHDSVIHTAGGITSMAASMLHGFHRHRGSDSLAMPGEGVSQEPTHASVACTSDDPGPPDERYVMESPEEVAKGNPALAQALQKAAKNNEVMLALANGIMICRNTTICWWNGGNILESFLQIIDHNGISNHLIGVMDDETEAYLKGRKYNWFRVNVEPPKSQEKSHPANKVSTIKYTLLKEIIQMGYHTLITDMDLVYMKNPFDHLHRDMDIEVQTDGYDDTAYGVIESIHDPSMGWGGGGLYVKLFTTNVGCMWVKANHRSFTLMSQVSDHLTSKAGWDQQVFNEYLLRPSHADFRSAGCSLRVLDYTRFTNSKIFFKSRRASFLPGKSSVAQEPLMVHFNYHPDKHVRMLCIMDRYFNGNVSACDHFPPGSEPT